MTKLKTNALSAVILLVPGKLGIKALLGRIVLYIIANFISLGGDDLSQI